MLIREAKSKDLGQVVDLMMAYIVDFYKQPHPGREAVEQLASHLMDHRDRGIQFVADDGEKVLGFATLYFTFSTLKVKPAAILNDLFVDSSVRNQKVGESLFRHCLNFIRENGFAYMQWETDKDNHVAQSLYAKMGGQISEHILYEME